MVHARRQRHRDQARLSRAGSAAHPPEPRRARLGHHHHARHRRRRTAVSPGGGRGARRASADPARRVARLSAHAVPNGSPPTRCVSIFGEHPGRQTVEVDDPRHRGGGSRSARPRSPGARRPAWSRHTLCGNRPFRHRVVIEEEMPIDRGMPRREFAEQAVRRFASRLETVRPAPPRRLARLVLLAAECDARRPSAAAPTPGTSTRWWRGRRRTRSSALVERWRDPARDRRSRSRPTCSRKPTARTRWSPRLDRRRALLGLDLDLRTARRARLRFDGAGLKVVVADLRTTRPARRCARSGGVAVDARSLPDAARARRRRCSRSAACCVRAAPRSSSSTTRSIRSITLSAGSRRGLAPSRSAARSGAAACARRSSSSASTCSGTTTRSTTRAACSRW